ncbi:stage II sporulation protein D [Desulfitispora alkaliphila]|uniref:stage II sporulation protein D n=1 Tax=Desulfitispora alkaliphila TaxID=622674 RepID=UPI003D1C2228
MRRTVAIMSALFILAISVIVFIPALVVTLSQGGQEEKKEEIGELKAYEGPNIKLYRTEIGETVNIPLEEYLVGVVAAEMPAKFEVEALKAQAVAARTYTLRRMQERDQRFNGAHLSDNPDTCQAYYSDDELQTRWGIASYAHYKSKISRAVQETAGIVITHGGDLINPLYHSTCGGKTENSENVWESHEPYLRSIDCVWGEDSPRYQESFSFNWSELDRVLGTNLNTLPASSLNGSSNQVAQVLARTDTGRVDQISLGGKSFEATELRRLLGLNSTNIRYDINANGIIFHTQGFGHGVGLCQYGANGQAVDGRTYDQILKYYYKGVSLAKINK